MMTKPDFIPWYINRNKQETKDFVLSALKFHFENLGKIPGRIVMNRKEIGFLKGMRGIEFHRHKIPIDTAKNCLIYHVQFHDN